MKKYKEGDHVRLVEYEADDPNAYAKINCIYPDGSICLVNANMPFMGTINEIVSKDKFHKMTNNAYK